MLTNKIKALLIGLASLLFVNSAAFANSKILATGGATQLEGQAGGGLVPWAVMSSYADTGEWGATAAYTQVEVDDFELQVLGANASYNNRIEFGYVYQELQVKPLNLKIRQDVFGAKLRLTGDVLYGATPQISAGVMYKKNHDFDVPESLGANSRSGIDVYLSVTRLWLDAFYGRNVLLNGTARWTEANQTGLLGFGGKNGSSYGWEIEASAGLFINRHWAVGAEYRQKPDNLNGVREQDWKDAFIAWFPTKHVSVVAAYSDLGDIAGLPDQSGLYLSVQLTP